MNAQQQTNAENAIKQIALSPVGGVWGINGINQLFRLKNGIRHYACTDKPIKQLSIGKYHISSDDSKIIVWAVDMNNQLWNCHLVIGT